MSWSLVGGIGRMEEKSKGRGNEEEECEEKKI
jgi:hypothetical protein